MCRRWHLRRDASPPHFPPGPWCFFAALHPRLRRSAPIELTTCSFTQPAPGHATRLRLSFPSLQLVSDLPPGHGCATSPSPQHQRPQTAIPGQSPGDTLNSLRCRRNASWPSSALGARHDAGLCSASRTACDFCGSPGFHCLGKLRRQLSCLNPGISAQSVAGPSMLCS